MNIMYTQGIVPSLINYLVHFSVQHFINKQVFYVFVPVNLHKQLKINKRLISLFRVINDS